MKAKQAIPIGITAAVLIAGLIGCIAVMSRDKGSTAQIYREDKSFEEMYQTISEALTSLMKGGDKS